ncbi:ATP-binding protein [Hydrogenophaga sp. PAMC20947]|uniref:ATP-binding protein n=1 Tax=Hydrogenophaga sp. PAMC20947 TaxID=2565558 RepID=UPI00109D8FB8|nr:ATP-binding protein [Hydrogenophaga sp. PAMC20947]QCB45021.1 response regulator [Hydrogenophaga sp. PAMC20947]
MFSIRYKAWALVVVTVAVLTTVAVWFSSQSISTSFLVLEKARAEQDGERARRMLQQNLANLSASGRDYAFWVDTVRFATGKNPSFLKDNFPSETMQSLRLSGVLVYDAKGVLVGGTSLTAEATLVKPSPEEEQVAHALIGSVLSDPHSETLIETYRQIDGTLYLLSVAPVREQLAVGTPPKGAQVVFRRFGAFEHERFAQVMLNPVDFSFDTGQVRWVDLELRVLGDSRAEARAGVMDHQNQPVAHLVVSLDRLLHQKGQSLIWATAVQVALAGLVMGALLVLLLDRLLLRRLKRMHQQLIAIGEQGAQTGVPIEESGHDELSDLGRGLNEVLVLSRQMVMQRENHAVQEAEQVKLAQTEKAEALHRFVGGIAHDFNNALAGISGWTRLAMEDLDKTHPAYESLQHALKGSRHASNLIRQLQAYNRKAAPVLQWLSLGDLIQPSFSLLDPSQARRCELQVVSLNGHAWVKADPTQMQQVLTNLLANAADAMNGTGKITVTVDHVDLPAPSGVLMVAEAAVLPAGRYVLLSVGDEGPGIAPGNLHRIFDPFFTTKSVGRGTGLGLSVSQGILSRHGGVIGVVSQPGQGTTFHVYLPACLEPGELAVPLPASDALVCGGRLLFVDDDHLVRTAWSALLERAGWDVTQAVDGEAAWAMFQQGDQRWDVVLTDLAMPRLDGVELARRIRSTSGAPPIVLMSGNVGAEEGARLVRGDFAAVLHKPVDPEALNKVLAEVLTKATSL